MTKKSAARSRGKGQGAPLEQQVRTLKTQHAELGRAHAATLERLGALQRRVATLEEQVDQRLSEALDAVAYGPARAPAIDVRALPGLPKTSPRRPWYARAWAAITRASAAEA